jgi:ABC-type multidrug transport system fused ATPase/permease subunit
MAEATLDPRLISETVNRLRQRVQARFPNSGLATVAAQLTEVAAKASATAEWIARPITALRILVFALIGLILLGIGLTLWTLPRPAGGLEFAQFIQVLESGINDVVLIVAAVFFLASLETRMKRSRALRSIHELRAIAHVIDMHQLTKDPEWILARGSETGILPPRSMTPFELSRYLDYCSEMLSITGKIAALYIQHFDDSVALQAVNEVESVTTALSGKIWQKLMILYALHGMEQGKAGGASPRPERPDEV